MSKYTCLFSTFWQDEKIRQLDDSGKMLFLAFLSVRSANMLGFYSYPYGYAMHDLNGWDDVKFRLYEGQLSKLGIAHYDYSAEVVLVQNYLKYNTLASVKQIASAYKNLKDVPTTYLLMMFADIWDTFVFAPYKTSYEQRCRSCKDDKDRVRIEASFSEVFKMTKSVRLYATEVRKLYPDTQDRVSIPYPELGGDDRDPTQDTLSHHITETETETYNLQQKQKQKQHPPNGISTPETPDTVSDLLDAIRALWSEILVPAGLPEIVLFTEARRATLLSRIDEDPQRSSLEWWSDLFYRIAYRTFFPRLIAEHTGQWVTFDWLMAEENFIPLLEGKYDGDRKKASSPEAIAMKSPSTILRERFEEAPKGYIDIADIDATTTESEVHGNDE